MISWVERRNEYAYIYTNSSGMTGIVGALTLLALINHHGATEEVEDYLREDCGWVHL